MGILENQVMEDIKLNCKEIQTMADHLESKSRDPRATVEDIEQKAMEVYEALGFLDKTIEEYRVKREYAQ